MRNALDWMQFATLMVSFFCIWLNFGFPREYFLCFGKATYFHVQDEELDIGHMG